MSALYLLIFVSLLIAIGFLIAYLWAVRRGQYDDTCTPALRILLDEPPPPPPDRPKPRKVASWTNHGKSPNPADR
jgi:cbb3-type cytochrome oxidase maturation protein